MSGTCTCLKSGRFLHFAFLTSSGCVPTIARQWGQDSDHLTDASFALLEAKHARHQVQALYVTASASLNPKSFAGLEAEHTRQQPQPDPSLGLRHVSSAESRELHEVGFDMGKGGPDATSGPVTR